MIFKTQSKFIPRDFTLFDAAVSGLLSRFCRPAVTGVGHRRQGRAGARLHPSAMTRSRTAAAGEDVTGGADAAVTLDPGPGPKQTGAAGAGRGAWPSRPRPSGRQPARPRAQRGRLRPQPGAALLGRLLDALVVFLQSAFQVQEDFLRRKERTESCHAAAHAENER